MFDKLLPKEEKYFEYFSEMVAHIHQLADKAQALFSSVPYDRKLLLELIPMEKRCDEILHKVVKQLNKTFVTPFDREDIFALIKRLDDISDILLAASVRTDIFKVQSSIDGATEIMSIIQHQIQKLETVIAGFRDKHRRMDELKAVKDLETQADTVYRAAMTALFENEKDPIELMKKKEILDILENASDKCQSVANVIIAIFIKNS
jgi:predicted phosphate transport protein (TIGR00153 family)